MELIKINIVSIGWKGCYLISNKDCEFTLESKREFIRKNIDLSYPSSYITVDMTFRYVIII